MKCAKTVFGGLDMMLRIIEMRDCSSLRQMRKYIDSTESSVQDIVVAEVGYQSPAEECNDAGRTKTTAPETAPSQSSTGLTVTCGVELAADNQQDC
jgi:hypothetical protein